jgi:hypothetical protein
MSTLPPEADIGERDWDIRFVPQADIGLRRDFPFGMPMIAAGHAYTSDVSAARKRKSYLARFGKCWER